MIQSAQVFTPRPSQDPRENLRILKTPIKTPFSSQAKTPHFGGRRRRESSPLKRGTYLPPQPEEDSDSDDEPEADIVLVETNHPKVVEEDRDLVILEHVNVAVPHPEPKPQDTKPAVQFPIPQTAQPSVVQTPQRRRRVGGRASLHRAVLIRSAQRAVSGMRGEMEEEEEEDGEEEEVEETIQALEEVEEGDDEEEGYDDDGQEEDGREEEQEEEEEKEEETQRSTPLSGWRKSLGFVTGWALRSPAPPASAQTQEESSRREEHTHTPSPELEDMDVEPSHPPSYSQSTASLPRRTTPRAPSKSPRRQHPTVTRFMTPQVSRISSAGGRQRGRVARYSVGGFTPGGIYGASTVPPLQVGGSGGGGEGIRQSGPRRVRLVEPWKVEDIVIPGAGGGTASGAVEEEEEEEGWQDDDEEQDGEDREGEEREEREREEREREERYERVGTMSVSPSKRPVVSDAERKVSLPLSPPLFSLSAPLPPFYTHTNSHPHRQS